MVAKDPLGKPFPCPVCGADAWDTSPTVALGTVQIDGDGRIHGDVSFEQAVVLVPVSCEKCGFTLFLDARTAGVIK